MDAVHSGVLLSLLFDLAISVWRVLSPCSVAPSPKATWPHRTEIDCELTEIATIPHRRPASTSAYALHRTDRGNSLLVRRMHVWNTVHVLRRFFLCL